MTLDNREKSFENKYARDEEFRFRANAKAVRLFGLWAAAQLGRQGDAANAYAEEVVEADFDEPGIKDVLRKVQKDLKDAGHDVTEHHLENQFNLCLEEAKKALA